MKPPPPFFTALKLVKMVTNLHSAKSRGLKYEAYLFPPPVGCVSIQPWLVACMELVSDGVKWVATQNTGMVVVIKPRDFKVVPVDEDSDRMAFLWAEQVVTDDCDTEKGIHFFFINA